MPNCRGLQSSTIMYNMIQELQNYISPRGSSLTACLLLGERIKETCAEPMVPYSKPCPHFLRFALPDVVRGRKGMLHKPATSSNCRLLDSLASQHCPQKNGAQPPSTLSFGPIRPIGLASSEVCSTPPPKNQLSPGADQLGAF